MLPTESQIAEQQQSGQTIDLLPGWATLHLVGRPHPAARVWSAAQQATLATRPEVVLHHALRQYRTGAGSEPSFQGSATRTLAL